MLGIKCKNCGLYNPVNAVYCGRCGLSLKTNDSSSINDQTQTHEKASTTNTKDNSWIDSINDYVGNDKPADLNWRILFSDVFKPHSTEEAEELFICGTKTTTPDAQHVSQDWPHPWLYSRVLLMFLITFALLWICVNTFENINAFPGMIVIGSFAVPLSTMILFMEANVWRNVSMYHILQIFFMGGCASLVTTLFLFSCYSVDEMDFIGAFLIGLIEEVGKALIVFWFLQKLGKLSILTGLLVGAAVGAGFAAFESAGYALQPFVQFQQVSGFAAAYGQELNQSLIMDTINHTIFIRGVLAPGGHVAWAAISGAAMVITANAKGVIDSTLWSDNHYLRLFAIPVLLHGLWDSPVAAWFHELIPFSGHIALIVAVWIVVLILINMGLSEVSRNVSSINEQ